MKKPQVLTWIAVAGWLALCCASMAGAAEKRFRLSVDAGAYDRANTPVCVTLDVPDGVQSVELKDASGRSLPAQCTAAGVLNDAAEGTAELHFVLPALGRGETLDLQATFSDEPPAADRFAWKHEQGKYAELRVGGRPLVRYMCQPPDFDDPDVLEETYKVYHHLYDPAGTERITKGPGGKYPHHRGLFFGYCHVRYGDGKRANTWSGRSTPEVHTGFAAKEAGAVLGRHVSIVEWRGSDQKPYLKEHRQVAAYRMPGGYLVEWSTRAEAVEGTVELDGNAPHAGFHFRAAQEVAAETSGQTFYVRPDGKGAMGQARGSAQNLAWDAISFVVGGNRYTVLYLDRPENPKPVEYNERTYGRFGSFFKYDVEPENDLAIRYRVWVQDGEMNVEQCAALHADFVDPPKVTVRSPE